ncbi:MAG: hypothetical protein WAM60_20240 [Candidatus Promineifilaceae bacterium]
MDVVLESLLEKMQTTELDINIHVKATFNVTPFVARQKVNVMLLDRVGTGLLAESPDLVATDGRLRWRVPVILALPGHGHVGQVGTVDVDVQSGEILADDALIESIVQHATQLAPSSTL